MRRKDPLKIWSEDRGLTQIRKFFARVDPTPEEKERIKEKAWAKIAAQPSAAAAAGLAPAEKPSAENSAGSGDSYLPPERSPSGEKPGAENLPAAALNLRERAALLLGRWGWKAVVPLAVVLLSWGGWQVLNPPRLGGLSGGAAISSGAGGSVGTSAARTPQSAAQPAAGGAPKHSLNSSFAPKTASNPPGAVAGTPAASAPLPDTAGKGETGTGQNTFPRKITQNLSLVIQVAQVQTALSQVGAEAQKLGGYVVNMEQTNAAGGASGHITVKVPDGRMQEMKGRVSALGKVLNEQLNSNDITDQYYDTQTLLANWQAEEKQYLKILGQAKTVDEVLKVESALSNVRGQIQLLEGRLKLMNNQVDYATIDLQLVPQPNPNVKVGTPWRPAAWGLTWQAAVAAFSKTLTGSWNLLNYIIIGLGYAAPYLFLGVLGWLGYLLLKKYRSRKK
ncbi:Domain of unknown function (DUF4349) [Acididesulfobacillus acetoxydans]|uniref:DUF4349 domain-containing protein n=1 Tax=Acididesulfobacillus acetoxydans TaxID=1561005 RepID=A0A8S0VXD3_9FIRM|nr:DUF4349 domain-containing protein [Acididesulfobacillus acetoxydans]CAA7601803.1 Domain of unknown function (DUF4349) [Acididesulfobacillus acetoxydans]CEJ09223.1 Domain of unknown function (DUF4349) [Acididesulfobacillus acetoxydans]